MTDKPRRRKVYRQVEAWKRVDIPPQSLAFAERRVSYLEGPAFAHPLRYLLACAYLQGINDCVAAHDRNPSLLTMAEVT